MWTASYSGLGGTAGGKNKQSEAEVRASGYSGWLKMSIELGSKGEWAALTRTDVVLTPGASAYKLAHPDRKRQDRSGFLIGRARPRAVFLGKGVI